jgi:lysophospholipase L1-like esterase
MVAVVGVLGASCAADRAAVSGPPFGQAEPPDTGTNPGAGAEGAIRSVAMVGDSITVGAKSALEDAFSELPLDVWSIDAVDGRRIAVAGDDRPSGADVVNRLSASHPPDLWVIALGTNDVRQYASAEEYRNQIADVLHRIPEGAPLVWVDAYLSSDPDQSEQFNEALRDTIAFRGDASVADWATVASADGMLSDGIHPTPEGRERFADVVAAAVQPWLD